MTLGTLIRFQFGNRTAITELARSKAALPAGVLLVLMTAVARSYDQTHILEKPLLWLFGPLLFSFGSACFIFLLIYPVFIHRRLFDPHPGTGEQFVSFLGLFWMTAPIGWLYAIPVERFLNSYQAAQANLALLGVVALWRVLLLARVFSVVQQAALGRTLLWVLLPASVEVLGLYIFGGAFAKAVMAGMGGMRNSPEEELLLHGLYISANAAFWIGLAALFLIPLSRNVGKLEPFPIREKSGAPLAALAVLSVLWAGIAIFPQQELRRNVTVEQMMANGQYKEALKFLSAHLPSDFAPARTLPPKPYERKIFDQLPELFLAMDGSEAPWVRQRYLDYMEIVLSHRVYFNIEGNFAGMIESLQEMPEGPAWLQKSGTDLNIFFEKHLNATNPAIPKLEQILNSLGTVTNPPVQ